MDQEKRQRHFLAGKARWKSRHEHFIDKRKSFLTTPIQTGLQGTPKLQFIGFLCTNPGNHAVRRRHVHRTSRSKRAESMTICVLTVRAHPCKQICDAYENSPLHAQHIGEAQTYHAIDDDQSNANAGFSNGAPKSVTMTRNNLNH